MPRGGHFAAFEEPKLLTDDIKRFVRTVLKNEWISKTKFKINLNLKFFIEFY